MSNPSQKAICSSRNKSQMAPNEHVFVLEKLGFKLKEIYIYIYIGHYRTHIRKYKKLYEVYETRILNMNRSDGLSLRDMLSLGAWRMGLGCSGKILPSSPSSSPGCSIFFANAAYLSPMLNMFHQYCIFFANIGLGHLA